MENDHDLERLARLVADVFELGARKAESDVGDEVCAHFDLDLKRLEGKYGATPRQGLNDAQQKELRREVSALLAVSAHSIESLMSIVAQAGAKFLQMVDEIYELLSKSSATTQGASEEFRFRKDDLHIDLTLSDAFVERLRRLVRRLSEIELGEVDEDALRKLLLFDGDFYGSWPLATVGWQKPEGSRNLARGMTYLAWLRDEIEREPYWTALNDDLNRASSAAKDFVNEAMVLVGAHVRALERENSAATSETPGGSSGSDEGDIGPGEYETRMREYEKSVFLERGLLPSGIRASMMGFDDESRDGWLYVNPSRLLAGESKLGAAPDCIQILRDHPFSGSAVSNLACLCALWKAGVRNRPRPRESDGLHEAIAARNPLAAREWLSTLTGHLREAAPWLRLEVWRPTGVETRETLIEIVEEFLNLPLWRERWLLYEVWLIVATARAAEANGWMVELNLHKEGRSTWRLPSGKAKEPVAILRRAGDRDLEIAVWREDRRKRNGIEINPDVSLSTVGEIRRELVLVEGKDRYRMATKKPEGAIAIGNKYRDASQAELTWIVNYGTFDDDQLADVAKNHGDPWRELHFAAEFKPGRIPRYFERTIGQALHPLRERRAVCDGATSRSWVFLIDTTGSMHDQLSRIWDAIGALTIPAVEQTNTHWIVLFGDHDTAHVEDYVTRTVGPSASFQDLVREARKQPETNGGDTPEALEDAMREAASIARKSADLLSIVVFTDAPPHSPNDCPSKIVFDEEVQRLLMDGHCIAVVSDWMPPDVVSRWKPFETDPGFRWVGLSDVPRLFNEWRVVGRAARG